MPGGITRDRQNFTFNLMTMQLGTETGSVVNHLYSRHANNIPVAGKGATELKWTDRHAYFVNWVSDDLKECTIERAKAIRTDSNGMSECQVYEYERTGEIMDLKFRWNAWRNFYTCPYTGKKKNSKKSISFGFMEEYYDFSF